MGSSKRNDIYCKRSIPPFIPLSLPECFSDHILVGDAVVGQGFAPHGVERVVQRLGAKFIGLEEGEKEKRTSGRADYFTVLNVICLSDSRRQPSVIPQAVAEMLPDFCKQAGEKNAQSRSGW